MNTLRKFDSSPLKSYRNRKGSSSKHHFSGAFSAKLRGGGTWLGVVRTNQMNARIQHRQNSASTGSREHLDRVDELDEQMSALTSL